MLQLKHNIADLATENQIPIDQLLDQLDTILRQLAVVRSTRTPPGRDEKIITAWNALAIRAFSAAGLLLNRDDFLVSARKATAFILEHIQTRNGHLYRTWGEGKASQPGTLSDYAGMIIALHAIYEVDFDSVTFTKMSNLYQILQKEFSSIEGLYFDTAEDVSHLIVRPKSVTDNALPSGNALVGNVHWLLSNYQEDTNHIDRLSLMLSLIAQKAQQYPTSFGAWLALADRFQNPTTQVAIVSDNDALSLKPFLDIYRQSYRPNHIIAAKYQRTQNQMGDPALLHNREALHGKPTAYICQGFTCQQPQTDLKAFRKQLEKEYTVGQ